MSQQKLSKEEQLRHIVIESFELLKREKSYKQNQIINKLQTLNLGVSMASFSNLLKGKPVGSDVLQKTATGIQDIIKSELGLIYQTNKFEAQNAPEWQPILIKETNLTNPTLTNEAVLPGFVFHSAGRLTIPYKTGFMQSAQSNIIEVGIRLKTFTEYFFSRNEQEYKAHIVALLARGVNMKFYMLDPNCNIASMYFADRATAQEDENESIKDMQKILIKIKKLHAEFQTQNLKGTFEVYLYKHVPTSHFFVVDGNTPNGKMLVSPYLYGLRRAECPVMEVEKSGQPVLFKKYFTSLQAIIKDAVQVIPKLID